LLKQKLYGPQTGNPRSSIKAVTSNSIIHSPSSDSVQF
jgi:hypothetical protein